MTERFLKAEQTGDCRSAPHPKLDVSIITAYNSANGDRNMQEENVRNTLHVIRGFLLSLESLVP